MGGGSDRTTAAAPGWSSRSSDDLVHITTAAEDMDLSAGAEANPWAGSSRSSIDSFDGPSASAAQSQPVSAQSADSARAHLLYCKSHVYVHPSAHSKDNIPGILGLAEVESRSDRTAAAGKMGSQQRGMVVLFWIPRVLAETLGERERYAAWEERVGGGGVDKGTAGLGIRQESKGYGADEEEYVFVTLPQPEASSATSGPPTTIDPAGYAFSIPLVQVYSLLVYPPSLGSWYGSVTVNTLDGVAMSTLYFHDDESPSTIQLMSASPPTPSSKGRSGSATGNGTPSPGTPGRGSRPSSSWGATPFFTLLKTGTFCELLRSRLEPSLYLVNPSRGDREVHEIDLGEDDDRVVPRALQPSGRASGSGKRVAEAYPPAAGFPSTIAFPSYGLDGVREGEHLDLPIPSALHPARTQFLSSFSQLTQQAKQLTTSVLSHPLAKPLVPHLPEPVRSLVTVPGEWESTGERQKRAREAKAKGKGKGVGMGDYESARVYLARWARIVSEEGERARKAEVAGGAGIQGDGEGEGDEGAAGIFEVIKAASSGKPQPKTTRQHGHPITESDFTEWLEKGLDEAHLRREVFRRGCSDGKARQWIWEVLLGAIPWQVGLGEDKQAALAARDHIRQDLRAEYDRLRAGWQSAPAAASPPSEEALAKAKEEWHRIDSLSNLQRLSRERDVFACLLVPPNRDVQVDCRRTDRNQTIFAVPDELTGNEEKEGGGAGADDVETNNGGMGEAEPGSQTALNRHIASLRTILMTYHMYSPTLGYVQGMSDLLSPIYVAFDADEASSFWTFVGLMQITENNFLRDQSGMRAKLTTLQQLIRIMDPDLHTHLENTDSLNLFFCFRWILIIFKREFNFNDIPRLWDALFSRQYSSSFELFIALAILSEHRDIIMRYLVEFDEVLKYANDLSGTIDLDSTLAQAEVLFLTFRNLVEEVDRNEIIRAGKDKEEAIGLRQRRGKAAEQAAPRSSGIPEDLRDLLSRPSLPVAVQALQEGARAVSLDEAAIGYTIELSKSCPVSQGAFCVGCVVLLLASSRHYSQLEQHFPILQSDAEASVNAQETNGQAHDHRRLILATGYSRELEGNTHAEANAIAKMTQVLTARGLTIDDIASDLVLYASMEPCSVRTSGLPSCSSAIRNTGIKRVCIGVEEPSDYVECEGVRELQNAGVEIVRVRGLEQECLDAARRGQLQRP